MNEVNSHTNRKYLSIDRLLFSIEAVFFALSFSTDRREKFGTFVGQ